MPCGVRPCPTLLSLVLLAAVSVAAQTPPPVRGYLNDSALALLKPLIGRWRPVVVYTPPGGTAPQSVVAENYRWTVGGKAIHYLENYPEPHPDSAQVDGLIYWNPATERVEFLGVAGHGAGQGRLYVGEYRELADGSLERVFEGFYRTPEDVPDDAAGGLRRRYRQRFRFLTPDSVSYELEWFHDGAWRPFGRFAHNTLVRLPK